MKNISIEKLILENLILNDSFVRQSIPFIKEEYFTEKEDQSIFKVVETYFGKTNTCPHQNILLIEINEAHLNSMEMDQAKETIKDIFQNKELVEDVKWLLEQTEQWCRDRSMYLSIVKAISIYDGTDTSLGTYAIPDMMRDSLSISFNTRIGSDWEDDAEARFSRYEIPENKIPFDLETLNDITFGGVSRKTLSIILGGVHVGKTFSLVHLASGYARMGFDVLYISMEMDEDSIMHRVDANMLKVPMHKIKELGKEIFMNRIAYLRQKSYGRIKAIQFPTSMAHVGHFRTLISELQMKLRWKPAVILIDYVGIVASSRLKVGMTNSHFYLKSVAEEMRAMAIDLDVCIWTGMQLTRGGMSSNDVEMTDIAESIGIPGVCDFMLAITRNEEMDSLNQISCKQLKNRFRNMNYKPKFILGSDFDQQLLYDVSESEQSLSYSEPVSKIDNEKIESKFKNAFRKKLDFSGVQY